MDARTIVMICIGVINMIVLAAGATAFVKVLSGKVFNLSVNVEKIEMLVNKILDKLEKFGERIASIETRCTERHFSKGKMLKAKKKK
jgi:hypothetical protein